MGKRASPQIRIFISHILASALASLPLDRPEPRMSLPVLIQHLACSKLASYCEQKLPPLARDKIRLEIDIDGETVVLSESRPHFRNTATWVRLPVAGFRFNLASRTWTLLCPKIGQPGSWRVYPARPEHDLGKLIKLLDLDETGAFWG